MYLKRSSTGLAFCLFYLASYFTNKYVLSVLKFTYPTLFQGWQTLVGGFLLHVSWKIGWVEIGSSSRSEVLSWLPASALFVGIIYSGSRALSRLQTSAPKICRVLMLLVASGCLPFFDPQFDTDGYFWALIHLLCVGAYKVFHKLWRPSSLSASEQQYINYAFSVAILAFASHPTVHSLGDFFSALEFPFLYFYSFHSSCLASGLLGFLVTLHTMKLKGNSSSGQYVTWNFLAKVITASLSLFCFEITVNVPTTCCLLLGGFAEGLLLYPERTDT
ncbi:transmembrane protein 241 isoform X6 [Varanus komodoensis]|uniref:transmembrane protein 241 isoform X6 n=1 Tax=Varanus komodoensis TaxID=61221 RepID=UPI001CF78A17|nr:transmembrane protein 241 isoform X6 [Varanus komodoensis]